MRWLLALLLNGLCVFAAGKVLPGVSVESYMTAVVAGLLLAIANTIVRPVLVLLTLPITLLTLGLFLLVINAAMVLLVDAILPGFEVAGFVWALVLSLVLAALNGFVRRRVNPMAHNGVQT